MVALLTEGVDRNKSTPTCFFTKETVALLTEGVDRNKLTEFGPLYDEQDVALLTEGVDRNASR